MPTIVIGDQVRIPKITSLAAFRRWARSPEFPEHGWFSYLDGDLYVDVSMEKLVHNLLKTCFVTCLGSLVRQETRGHYCGDRMALINDDAGLSTEPDGMFISNSSLDKRRVRLKRGDNSVEVLGSPDMTLEIISASSVDKDTVVLRELYWRARVREYWLVDGRAKEPQIQILRRGRTKYSPVRSVGGWVRSSVFGKSFRLVRRDAGHGISEFTLEIK
jgi:Uma2 family endonuclease